jgi:hypothetical protein
MEIKSGQDVIVGSNATAVMESGDHLSVSYKNSHGVWHTFNLSARHLVFIADHEQSAAAIVIRPAGVHCIPSR